MSSRTRGGRLPRTKRVNLLDTIPVPSAHITTEWDADGCAVLVYPRFKRRWMRRLFLPKALSPYLHVRLEAHGTAVWRLLDGRRTVRQLITLLAGHFAGEADYPSRVTAYLMQLQRDGFIRLQVRDE